MPKRPTPATLMASAYRLSDEDLAVLIEQLQAELRDRQTSTTVDVPEWREEYRKCGKSGCWCATADRGHGPYRYRSVRRNGRVAKEYQRQVKVCPPIISE